MIPGFSLELGLLFVQSFCICSPDVHMGFLQVLWVLLTVQNIQVGLTTLNSPIFE